MFRIVLALFLGFAGLPALAETLVVYSGRSKVLVEPLVRRFEAETGVRVRVRYGTDAQLLLLLEAEGKRSPADVFWANSPGALVQAEARGLLRPLSFELRSRPARFVPASGGWVPLSLRLRVLAWREGAVDPRALPDRVLELPEVPGFEGRIGWTPRYSSFVDFVTALRHLEGEDAARAWLVGMRAKRPKAYASNTPMLLDLAQGELDLALTNHYYVYRLRYGGEEGEYEEEGEHEEAREELRVAGGIGVHHFAPKDAGNLALVTGGGVLATSQRARLAERFLGFMLSGAAQRFFAETVHEYPVVRGVPLPPRLEPLDRVLALSPDLDYRVLLDLDATLELLREVGIH